MSMILNLSLPRGAATSTVSPFFRPMIALPTGDSFESLFSAGFASAEPTMWYSTVLFALTSRRRTFVPTDTSPDLISFFVTTRELLRRSSSSAMRASRWACSFFAESYSAFSAMSPNSRASRMRSAISRRLSVERNSISSWSFLCPSGVRMTSFKTPVLLTRSRNNRRHPASGGCGWYLRPGMDVNSAWLRCPDVVKPARILVDPRRRDPDPGRARPDGRRQRPGLSPAGAALRCRARLLRDGLLRRDRAPEREDARLPARRHRRASPGDPDLRVRAGRDGRRGPHGRGRRRRHCGHELRLPRPQGDEDGGRRQPARRRRARLPDHRRRCPGRRGPGQRE